MALPPDVKTVLDRLETAKARRGVWEPHWQDLAGVMRPVRADFTASTVEGSRRTNEIYDSTPLIAVRGLASAIEGLVTPKTERWFHIKTGDPDLDEEDDVKEWLEDAENRMWRAMYAAPARFTKSFAEAYLDLATFGTAAVFVGESRDMQRLSFRALHLKNVFILLNSEGFVDTAFLLDRLTARQAAQRYGEENLGEKTREALTNDDQKDTREQRFEFVQAIFPREDRNPASRFSTDMPFASMDIDVRSEHKISEGGFEEFPLVVMRWDTAAGEDYGRSPGMLALPDSLTLNQMSKTLLKAGHMSVDPALFLPSDSMTSVPRAFPGGISYFDGEALNQSGLRQPFFALESGKNMPLGLEMQNQLRGQIFAAFFKNVLELPTEGPQMSATEIIERKQEFVRTIGPVFGRLEADGPAPTVQRVFGIMARAGAFRDPPERIQGREPEFEYESPIERVRKSIEAHSARAALELVAPFGEIDPEVFDHFDTDEIAREGSRGVSMPSRWQRSQEDVAKRREARQQRQAAAEQVDGALDTAERVSQVEKNAPGLVGQVADAV